MAEQQDLAAELVEAKRLLTELVGGIDRTTWCDTGVSEQALESARAFLTRPAPAPDKGEVERLREAVASALRYLRNPDTWPTEAALIRHLDAALTPAAPDAAEAGQPTADGRE